jgi:hypothetical protein
MWAQFALTGLGFLVKSPSQYQFAISEMDGSTRTSNSTGIKRRVWHLEVFLDLDRCLDGPCNPKNPPR